MTVSTLERANNEEVQQGENGRNQDVVPRNHVSHEVVTVSQDRRAVVNLELIFVPSSLRRSSQRGG